MVERLREAIEKARAQRGGAPITEARPGAVAEAPGGWSDIEEIAPSAAHLARQRIVTHGKTHPVHVAFDVLRTRLLKACRSNKWSTIGIVSPTKGCGKSMLSLNLAFSAARRSDMRTVLLDLDLRAPKVAQALGVTGDWRIADCLRGKADWRSSLRRIGDNFAVGLNSTGERHPAELMQGRAAADAMRALKETLRPDLIIVDLPPLLAVDDAIGFLDNLDAAVLVIAAGETRAKQVTECETLIAPATTLLGVIMNKVDTASSETQIYEYESD